MLKWLIFHPQWTIYFYGKDLFNAPVSHDILTSSLYVKVGSYFILAVLFYMLSCLQFHSNAATEQNVSFVRPLAAIIMSRSETPSMATDYCRHLINTHLSPKIKNQMSQR